MRMSFRKYSVTQFLGVALTMALGMGVGTASAANWLTEDVSKDLFSLGGRAMYFDPLDGDGKWSGGAQVRLHLGQVFAIEGSADYRRNDFGSTTVHTYPVQASGLIYLLPGKRISPFLLGGGGWYYTTVDGPGGYDDTQHRFGAHAGGGLQFMLNPNWSVDGSYRFVWLERVQSKDQNLFDKKFQDEGHMVTIGLNYHF
ncbi:MAG: outer membrane protein [Nitrospirales bacterium]